MIFTDTDGDACEATIRLFLFVDLESRRVYGARGETSIQRVIKLTSGLRYKHSVMHTRTTCNAACKKKNRTSVTDSTDMSRDLCDPVQLEIKRRVANLWLSRSSLVQEIILQILACTAIQPRRVA